MGTFIKLTAVDTTRKTTAAIHVNAGHIVGFMQQGSYTEIITTVDRGHAPVGGALSLLRVEESPEQILALIKDAER